MLNQLYNNQILKYPKIYLGVLTFIMSFMVIFAMRLEIDASSETLLLEGDKDLEFTRNIGKEFSSTDILVVTYTSNDDLLSNKNISNIKKLSKQITSTIKDIKDTTSIVTVPLLQSPPKPLSELIKDIPTIESENLNKTLAKKEFLNSAIYKQNLVSDDFKTTAIILNLKRDKKYFTLIKNRDKFYEIKKQRVLTKEENEKFKKASLELKTYRDILRVQNHENIVKIRSILREFENKHKVKLHLGGASMIADDMVEFVKYDLKTFGFAIVFLLVVILFVLLREIRWVIIPLFISFVSITITSGLLGLFGWEITVISSNYISLQLIMNMSLVVHLIIKYKELHKLHPTHTQNELLKDTCIAMSKPSFFVVITTITGFSSLVFSNILPIITFGWMMSVGIVVSLISTFILFPLVLSFLPKSKSDLKKDSSKSFTSKVGDIALNYKKTILALTIVTVIFSLSGATKLRVENSFIDYFKESTEIYKGMKLIDQKLGGTTPMDVILTFKENSDEIESLDIVHEEEDEELDDFSDEFEESEEDKQTYWFTTAKMDRIKQIHNYLETQEGIGKVLSLATIMEIGKSLNEGKDLDTLTLSLLYQELPQKYRDVILTPYVNVEKNRVRISTRIIDSMPNLQRDLLLKKINKDINELINPKYEEYKVSNLLVLYNNMLQSLFDSQIKTIGVVIGILFIMFLVLFKDLKIAIVAIIANTTPVSVIFGIMGWFDMPLDMMTITIAAISIGIAVDNTIHYIHRFNLEYKENNCYKKSVQKAHGSIGTAMFYTSTVIMIGFSILALSNFIPTIYFGLLTMIAMFMAIVADLLLLPVLLSFIRKGK